MRLWLSRKSPVSMREQIATQLMLGVISEDLKPGQRVPSVRELARSHQIHANTVSAAYRDLVQRGWLETRHGSGVYVRTLPPAPHAVVPPLDDLIATFLIEARSKGFSAADVLARLRAWRSSDPIRQVIVVEPEPELGEVLCEELRRSLSIPVSAVLLDVPLSATAIPDAAIVALVSRARQLDQAAPAGVPRVLLRLHSVAGTLKGQQRPAGDAIVTVISHSPELLRWTRTVLLAAAIDPVALDIRDAREPGWKRGLKMSAMIITDIVTARRLPAGLPVRVFRVIAESSIQELRGLTVSHV
jgi:GntR family transcriptional regulator